MNGIQNKHALAQTCVVAASFAVIIRLYFVQRQVFDDVALTMIPAGCGWIDHADWHILFSHLLIGKLLEWLYREHSGVPWYGWYLFLANMAGVAAGCLALVRRSASTVKWIIVAIFFAAICLPPTCLLNFTTAACMLGLGGFALILDWCHTPNLSKISRLLQPLVACIFLVISSFIRYEAGVLIQILSLTTIAISAIPPRPKQRLVICSGSILIGTALILSFCCHCWNNAVYSNVRGWSEFYDAVAIEREFADCGLGEKSPPKNKALALAATNWTSNDVLMVRYHFLFDSTRFNYKNLKTAKTILKSDHYTSAREVWKDFKPIFLNPTICPIIWAWFALLFVQGSPAFSRVRLILLALFSVGLMLSLLLTLKLPEWVYIPIFSFNLYICLFQTNQIHLHRLFAKHKPLTTLVTLIICAAISVSCYENYLARSTYFLTYDKALKNAIKSLCANKSSVYICWADSFPLGWLLPFDDIQSELQPLKILNLTWRDDNPLQIARSRRFNINVENFPQALTSKNVFFLGYPELNHLLQRYLLEHYGVETNFDLEKDYPPLRLAVYRIRPKIKLQ